MVRERTNQDPSGQARITRGQFFAGALILGGVVLAELKDIEGLSSAQQDNPLIDLRTSLIENFKLGGEKVSGILP